jgi:hypothetical protein
MKVSRPELSELLCVISVTVITDAGDIVRQRIQPYINYMLGIKVYRNSPLEGSTGYTEILKSGKKEVVHHLILSGNRLNEIRM